VLAALQRGEDRVLANRNSRGPWVARIRTALRIWDPAVPPGDVAGDYDAVLEAAVRRFKLERMVLPPDLLVPGVRRVASWPWTTWR
jgi:hypothetical protein